MSIKTFMNSIGNGFVKAGKGIGTAFKNGYQSGNLQKGLVIGGNALFSVGMASAMINDMNKTKSCSHCCNSNGRNSSIFGNMGYGGYMNGANMYWLNSFGGGIAGQDAFYALMNGMPCTGSNSVSTPYASLNQFGLFSNSSLGQQSFL